MKNFTYFFLTICKVLITCLASAQWQPTAGPYGGAIYSFARQGNLIIAGTLSGGIYTSKDSGVLWAPSYNGISRTNTVHSLLTIGSTVIAGTDYEGIFISKDTALSWIAASNGLASGTTILSMAQKGNKIFAGTRSGSIYFTTDTCQTWVKSASVGLPTKMVMSLLVSGTKLFAGTSGGLYVSLDEGATFSNISNGIAANTYTNALLAKGADLYAGADGVYKSSDNGVTWAKKVTGLNAAATSRSLYSDGTRIYFGTAMSGIYVTSDNADSWSQINTGLPTYQGIAFIHVGSKVLLGTSAGLYSTVNNGLQWSESNSGLSATDAGSFATNGTDLFCGVYATGMFRSSDGGNTWASINKGLESSVNAVLYHNNVLYAGTIYSMFKSTDLGQNWTSASSGLSGVWFKCLAVKGNTLYTGSNEGVFKSTDNAATWVAAKAGLPAGKQVTDILVDGTNLYAGTTAGIFVSSDDGASWNGLNTGLPSLDVVSIVRNGTGLFIVLGNGNNGVYKSTDNGATWTPANNGFNNTFAKKLYSTGNALFVSMIDAVYVSMDQGANWIAAPLLPENDVKAFQVLGNELFVGTYGAGVWKRQLSELTTSVASIVQSPIDVSVFPNPSTGDVFLTFKDQGQHIIHVFDSNGRKADTLEAAESLNLHITGKGIYYLQVIQQGNVVVKKVVIQ